MSSWANTSLGDRIRAEQALATSSEEGGPGDTSNQRSNQKSVRTDDVKKTLAQFKAIKDEGEKIWKEGSTSEQVVSLRKFNMLRDALGRSTSVHTQLQSLLERTIDQCEELCRARDQTKRAYEQLEKSQKETNRQLERLRASESEARHKCGRLQAEQQELQKDLQSVRAMCDDLRASEALCRMRCDQLRASEAELRGECEHHQRKRFDVDKALAAEKDAQQQAVVFRSWLRSFLSVMLRRDCARTDCDQLSSSDSEVPEVVDKESKARALLQAIVDSLENEENEQELLQQLEDSFESVCELIDNDGLVLPLGGKHLGRRLREKDTARAAELEARLMQEKETAVASAKAAVKAAAENERRALKNQVRRLQNTIQELTGSIRVFCRMRPPRQDAVVRREKPGLGCKCEGLQQIVLRKRNDGSSHDFFFDHVFAPEATQRDVYEEVEPLLPKILEGVHLCLFAYGQTGSGKTHTLSGGSSPGQEGIQSLAICDLLQLAEDSTSDSLPESDQPAMSYEIWLSALEIYNESIQDLLVAEGGSGGSNLDLRQCLSGDVEAHNGCTSPFGSMRVPGLQMWRIRRLEDVEPALQLVAANRHIASTALNNRSSRSHCVLSLSVARRRNEGVDDAALSSASTAASTGVLHSGVLHIVDLAGSERTKISQAEGQQMKEANAINKSLAALSDVLFSLGDDSPHVPYRNSKLTYLLKDALGSPGCKTVFFAQISPDANDINESYSTLTFASRVATTVQKGKLDTKKVPDAIARARSKSAVGNDRDRDRGAIDFGSTKSLPASAMRQSITTPRSATPRSKDRRGSLLSS